MEDKYINEYEITPALLREWARHPVGKKARRLRIFRILLGAALAVLVGVCLLIWLKNPRDILMLCITVVYAAFTVYYIFFGVKVRLKKQYDSFISLQPDKRWLRVQRFGGSVSCTDGNSTVRFTYPQITSVAHDDVWFYVFIGPDSVMRVKRDAFTTGDPDGFEAFIESCRAESAGGQNV